MACHRECLPMLPQTSTLPLSEGDILNHPKLVPEVDELRPRQRLGHNVCNLLICRYVLESNNSSLHHVLDEGISDLNMLRPVMENWIFRKIDTTLIITRSSQASDQIIQQVASEATQLLYLQHWLQYTLPLPY